MDKRKVKEAKLTLRAHEQKKEAERKRMERERVACNNCIFCEFIKGNFFKSSKYHCAVKECYVAYENEFEDLKLSIQAMECPCFENKHK